MRLIFEFNNTIIKLFKVLNQSQINYLKNNKMFKKNLQVILIKLEVIQDPIFIINNTF